MTAALDAPACPPVGTSAAVGGLLIDPPDSARAAWSALILERLVDWDGAGGPADADGFEPPLEAVVTLAHRLATRMKNNGDPPPDRVVPDGDGGLTFERRDGGRFQALHVYDDLTVELDTFENGRLLKSVSLPGPDGGE
jgi:hypothetical protein